MEHIIKCQQAANSFSNAKYSAMHTRHTNSHYAVSRTFLQVHKKH